MQNCRQKTPTAPSSALNNHQINSGFYASTGHDKSRKGQPPELQRGTHVPDMCTWAVSRGVFLVAGRLFHSHRKGKPLDNLSLCRVRMAWRGLVWGFLLQEGTLASPRQGPSPGWCQPCPNGPVLASQSSSLPRRALPGGGDLFIRNSWGKWPVMSVGARVPRERNDTQ